MKLRYVSLLLTFILVIGSIVSAYASDAKNNSVLLRYSKQIKEHGSIDFKSAFLKLDEYVTRQEAVSVTLDLMGYDLSKTKIYFVPYTDNFVEVVIEGTKKMEKNSVSQNFTMNRWI